MSPFNPITRWLAAPCLLATCLSAALAQSPVPEAVEKSIEDVMPNVVEWRRDIHAHPELGNREFRTAELVAEHLRELGMEVKTGIAHTGVTGILRGGNEGPVVALRADMD